MAAAAMAVRRNRERRQKIAQQRADNKHFVDDVMKTWDHTKTGDLQIDELQAWLSASCNENQPVSEAEAKWVIYMVNGAPDTRDKKDEELTTSSVNTAKTDSQYASKVAQAVQPGELPKALEHFMAYKKAKGTIESTFAKFDSDASGALDMAQLGKLLVELNEGLPVSEEETRWVMEHADVLGSNSITKPELIIAISLW
eukprot:CAMPEP_0173379446 /NCGR_PEP_ID=MMETSP1356-20130122/2388_1 /TAXON_ID=77927 ORGANISM="Hemiselmis virescens, Strain PCC157" /NCGR_SAMPLE_ID=MMETSP1356 /ASSEMBLY_ACC=CAM_ASM_000847 /LENGTH=198 /DNA_ID=CAMNT_0014332779 /DNA_START=52 /DNA_END=645 /DNA_ORIENTATION=+